MFLLLLLLCLLCCCSITDGRQVSSAIYTFEIQRELPHRGTQLAVDSCQVVLQVAHLLVIQQDMSRGSKLLINRLQVPLGTL